MTACVILQNAGFDTTKVSMLWLLAFLSTSPEAQDEIRREAQQCNGCYTDPPLSTQFPYTVRVLKEVLRLRAPFTNGAFETRADFEINGVTIPSHTPVLGLLGHICLDERNFSKASEFAPDRWLVPRDESRFPVHNEAGFVVFGGGKRICPGMHLGETELIIMLAEVCNRYSFKLVGEFPDSVNNYSLYPTPYDLEFSVRE
jgi:cytochrome P450